MRYLYDPQADRRLKTVELIVKSITSRPRPRHARRRDDEIVAVRIAYQETAPGRGLALAPKFWEITLRDAKRLGISDRVLPPHD